MEVLKDIKYNNTAQAANKNQKLILLIQDSIDNTHYELEKVASRMESLSYEKTSLLASKQVKGDFRKDSIIYLKETLEYLRLRLNNINDEFIKNKRDQAKLQKQYNRMQLTVNELKQGSINAGEQQAVTHRIKIIASTDVMVNGSVSVNYITYNANWIPFYDVRVNDVKGGIQLALKGKIKQYTGIDWKDCPITLSTNNPLQNNSLPMLSAQYLNFYNYYPKKKANRAITTGEAAPTAAQELAYDKYAALKEEKDDEMNAYDASSYTEQTEFLSVHEYNLKLNYTVPSDGKDHVVSITNKDVPSTFSHIAVPKLDKDAFLMANLTGFEELNLLPAEGNIYFNGTYIGKNYINPAETEDTLKISLGRDKNIVINRKKIKNDTKTKFIGDEIEKTVSFEIEIRNTGSFTSSLTLEDQIPVSQTNEIKVEIIDIDKATLDEASGKLTWKMDLKPKDSKKISFKYKIRYPKSKPIYGV
jgi:uncharacterized protein (TIGR02231 family)